MHPVRFLLSATIALLISACGSQQAQRHNNNYPKLALIGVNQLQYDDDRRFDLSGIANYEGGLYIAADKEWNEELYLIQLKEPNFVVSYTAPLPPLPDNDMFSIEALAAGKSKIYFANEDNHMVYEFYGQSLVELPIQFAEGGIDTDDWINNTGIEGLAVDEPGNRMFVAKEREPRYILECSLTDYSIQHKYTIPETESNDFADLFYENGHLYALERNGNYIAKINADTRQLVGKVSYRHICTPAEGRLYKGAKYGLAEALLMSDTEIWIGLDNNGREVADHAKEKYNLQGNKPVIIRFKRPEGF